MEFLAAAAATAPPVEQLDWLDYAWITFAVVIFTYVGRRVFRVGGDAVEVSEYGPVEIGLAALVALIYLSLGLLQYLAPPAPDDAKMTMSSLVAYAALIVTFTSVTVLTLTSRGRSLRVLFGLDRQPIWKAIAMALLLTFAAYPIVAVGAMLTQAFSKGPDDLQEIVKFFRGVGRDQEKLAVVISAVILAPLSEEFFFRGLIYGVAKKYGGLSAAMVFNAALFAFIHGSLPAFGGLFALAVCLTLAYELSGSLYVPIAMHACFNAAQLVQMFLDPATPKP